MEKPIHPLRELRESRHLTQGEAAALLGTSGVYISQIENGITRLSAKKAATVCRLFQVDPDQLQSYLQAYREALALYVRRKLRETA